MGLLDKPTIEEEVRAIRAKKENARMKAEYERVMGLAPLRKIKKKKRRRLDHSFRRLFKEWKNSTEFIAKM